MTIDVKFHHPNARLVRATAGSAGFDLAAVHLSEPQVLEPGEHADFLVGVSINLHTSYLAALVLPRSGLGTRHGVVLRNLVGLIDSDFTGEIKVTLVNNGQEPYTVLPNERIAQLVIVPVISCPEWRVVDEHLPTTRDNNGFGHSGRL
jgi:dUTP pyrophosphatase